MAYERNLILVHTQRLQARSDFETIKVKLRDRAPEIEVFIVDNSARQSVTRRQASQRPSLIFSPVALREFRPIRGKVYAGRSYTKIEEYQRLKAAGLSIPEAVLLQPDTLLDPDTWGPFTVLKPNVGQQGAGIRIQRTQHVRWSDPFAWRPDDPRYGRQIVAQRFVDTGPNAMAYRVFTVLGACGYSIAKYLKKPWPFSLDPAGREPIDYPMMVDSADLDRRLNFEEEIIEFGKAVYRAKPLPDVPALGVDVIREVGTGALYVLETNPGGQTWHLSSNYGQEFQRKLGANLSDQFGALDLIADRLAEVTRREAE